MALTAVLGGCATEEEVAKHEEALSHTGPWDIPDDTLAIGDTQYVEYTGAGPWIGSEACSGGLTEGASVLRGWLSTAFPQVDSIGGYSCRAIVGDSSRMSVHGTGRALDIMIPLHAGDADNDLGDPIGNWLIEHAEEIGIQYIIWDRWTWGASRPVGEKERAYGGTHPHHDHLHVELSVEAGRGNTAWFSGSMDLPDTTGCDPLPADGGVIEETSACFKAFGPATYWRHVDTAGHGGALVWTNAFSNDTPSNWGRWSIELTEGGRYGVEVFLTPGFAMNDRTHYAIRHGGSDTDLEVDQSAADGWLRIAELDFAAGGGQHVTVYDNVPTAVEPEQHIAADAVRLVRLTEAPPAEEPPPEPPPADDPELGDPPVGDPGAGEPPRIEGGDPTLDDDPLAPTGGISSGCSASGRLTSGSLSLAWVGLALLFLRRRRRM